MGPLTIGAPVIISFLMAVINTLLGYFKTTNPENFDLGKFLGTILIGVFVGFLTTGLGWTYESAMDWLASSNLIIWIYWLAKIIAKKLPNVKIQKT